MQSYHRFYKKAIFFFTNTGGWYAITAHFGVLMKAFFDALAQVQRDN